MMTGTQPPKPTLASWNDLDASTAAEAILPCNGSGSWAAGVVALRPFHSPEALFAASDRIWPRQSRNLPKPAMVQRRTKLRPAHHRHTNCARRRECSLRTKVRSHLHRLRQRQNRRRDARYPAHTSHQRSSNRTPRGRGATATDHPTPPAQVARGPYLTPILSS
jgi:hypothetical protein